MGDLSIKKKSQTKFSVTNVGMQHFVTHIISENTIRRIKSFRTTRRNSGFCSGGKQEDNIKRSYLITRNKCVRGVLS